MATKTKKDGKGKAWGSSSYAWAIWALIIALAALSVGYHQIQRQQKAAEEEKATAEAIKRAEGDVEKLMAQMQALSNGLASVAGRGKSKTFEMIQGMAAQAKNVLEEAQQATDPREARRILQEGLASKRTWLSALTDYSNQLQEDDEKEREERAPLSLDGSENVVQLSRNTFADYLAQNPRTMVEFFAPWCGHCKKLAPEYEKCAAKFKGRAGFVAVDGTKEEQLSRVFEVGGYPTLKWFVHGRPFDYEGPRTAAAISEWVETRLEPAFTEIDALSDLEAALEQAGDDATLIVGGTGPKRGGKDRLFTSFEIAAEKYRGKVLFAWAPADTQADEVWLYRSRQAPKKCASREQEGSECRGADDIISWLDEELNV